MEPSGKLKAFAGRLVKHRKVAIAAAIAALIVLSVFGAKIALFLNFVLGNDVVVKLDAGSEAMALAHGSSANATFSASVATNPFCMASCHSVFEDVSNSVVIDRADFTLKPGTPIKKSFSVEPQRFGTGQRLYRFSMECQSFTTALCHTSGEPTRRAVIVAVNYTLNETEIFLKSYLKPELSLLAGRVARIAGLQESLASTLDVMNSSVGVAFIMANFSSFAEKYPALDEALWSLIPIWEKQDYILLEKNAAAFGSELSAAEIALQELNSSVSAALIEYNSLVEGMSSLYAQLSALKESFIIRDSDAYSINAAVSSFSSAMDAFVSSRQLSEKGAITGNASFTVSSLSAELAQQSFNDSVSRMAQAALHYDVLCFVSGNCLPHLQMENVSSVRYASLLQACSGIEKLHLDYLAVNSSMEEAFALQGYPDSEEFWGNVSAIAGNAVSNVSGSYNLSKESANYGVIALSIASPEVVYAETYPEFSLSPAIVSVLLDGLPAECSASKVEIAELPPSTIAKITAAAVNESYTLLSLSEPVPQCCVFGECAACCDSEACLSGDDNFPVVFLHGHAFNKGVSAEYSLDAFNKMQERLEQDGYLNVGAITLYTDETVPAGLWGRANVPVTIKASYYFDLFEEPQNYVVVQASSESIDTYAVRLKELIGRIKYRTGRPKVHIIASSMGGLVARRYVQVFGSESVSGLILVGTPNRGVAGDIADFCPLIGERLECRDMSAGSLFLNKLNREPLPPVPVYNLVGTGCRMGNESGDGIVLAKNALLEGASNFFVNGTCSRLELLHTKMLDIDMHPEVYEIIRNALEGGK